MPTQEVYQSVNWPDNQISYRIIIGKEGPYVHISAMVAYQLAKLPIFSTIKKVGVCFIEKQYLSSTAPRFEDSNACRRLCCRSRRYVRSSSRRRIVFSRDNLHVLFDRKFVEGLLLCYLRSTLRKDHRKFGVSGTLLHQIRGCSVLEYGVIDLLHLWYLLRICRRALREIREAHVLSEEELQDFRKVRLPLPISNVGSPYRQVVAVALITALFSFPLEPWRVCNRSLLN